MMETSDKVEQLRNRMRKEGWDACLITSADAHLSEYVDEHWKTRQWLTGFTGSVGTAVVTLDDAGLWADGRYFIQAERQLQGSGIRLFRMGQPGVPTVEEWLAETLPAQGTLAVDGRTLSVSGCNSLNAALRNKTVTIVTAQDPAGALWQDRPEIPKDTIYIHEDRHAGRTRVQKLSDVRQAMFTHGATHYVLSALDDICWLYNIRGGDIPHNPYGTSFAVIEADSAVLFIDSDKIPDSVRETLASDRIRVLDYSSIYSYLGELDQAAIVYDPDKTNVSLKAAIPSSAAVIETRGLVTLLKAVKNEVEIENIRDSYLKDAAALIQLFKWLKETVPVEPVTELQVDLKGREFRKQQPLFVDLSFASISAYGDHAAMMHYAPTTEGQYTLGGKGFYLLDSGSHFLNGTTDITRTIPLGPLTDEEKRDFTLVLKSVIALSEARFLYGSTGSNLDILARKPLWDHGLDYKCGTGHGVGYFSNVHEEPQRFAQKTNDVRLEPGMIITVEPGVYKEGRHGIRTENTLLVAEDRTTESGRFLRFENLCFLPIDRSAVIPELLTPDEREWLNRYHREVFERLSPRLDDEHRAWLAQETAEI
ncbi:aminopeptidase P family protein [Paenibacillus sp. CN-4]|uniref:aminopeptidase P family protein n=1 Tax=Paenibacillus nanchangensis TaxID=3348343 RepID=UPI003979395E